MCVPATFHKCCSVYVISRVQIAFHTKLHTTINVFTSHIISSHRTERFLHITFHVTPFHTTPFHISHTTIAQHSTSHYYIPHVPRHISQAAFIVATDLTSDHHILHNITPQSASHHHITPHLEAQHVPHLTPFHTRNYSTPHPHSTSQHRSSHHTIFHIALHHHILILHHTTTSDITTHRLHFPHLTWHNNRSTLHMPHSSPPHFTSRNFPHFAVCNISHSTTPLSTPRHIPHHTFCSSIAFHIIRPVWNCNGLHRTTFHVAP